jgi:UDP:flavonoid glycosyltransferase YjiC (YdhE family)
LLVTHPLTLVGSLISELTGIPWISTVLSPSSFLSVYDSVAGAIASPYEQALAAMAKDVTLRQLRWHTRFWSAPVRQLRADLGLPPAADPLYEGQHSPHQVLALFSAIFATPQPDWPIQTYLTGFPFYDGPTSTSHTTPTPVQASRQAQLEDFLAAGSAPIVFTLGSSAVRAPGSFYQESLAAIRLLGGRAILLVGKQQPFPIPNGLPKGVMLLDYASHAMLFPHAAAVVHHGGIGTIAQALRAGCPMLVVPHNYEQPDNAERVVQLGVGRQLTKQKATATEIASELQQLLSQPQYRERAQQIRAFVQAENGVTKACEAIEAALD